MRGIILAGGSGMRLHPRNVACAAGPIAPRPRTSVLDLTELAAAGIGIEDAAPSLARYLES